MTKLKLLSRLVSVASLLLDCSWSTAAVLYRNTGERIEVLALPLNDSKGFTEDPSYPKSAGLLFGLMWLRAHIGAKKSLPAEHVV